MTDKRTYFIDTETCGLTGPIVLIQFAEGDGPVYLWNVWKQKVSDTLELIEHLCENNICAFNLAFDWFHLTKLYNLLHALPYRDKPPEINDVRRVAMSRPRQWCLKPAGALDLLCHVRKTEWQSLMDRHDIVIRRVPAQVANTIVDALNKILPFSDIYFSKKKNRERWKIKSKIGSPFVDIILKFAASMKLKILVQEIFKVSTKEIGIPKSLYPEENNHDPYTIHWGRVIDYHINYWENSKNGRTYAENDIIYLQRLFHYFGEPSFDDRDSLLTCCVGATRWCGFSINAIETTRQFNEALEDQKPPLEYSPPINVNSPYDPLRALREVATDAQRLLIKKSDADNLKMIMKFFPDAPVGQLASIIHKARLAKKKADLFTALLTTDRFCPDLKIVGTLSGRMSGGSDEGKVGKSVNPQGINKSSKLRRCFTLADEGEVLSWGDFWSFEVTIAAAAFRDVALIEDLKSGKSFHGLLGAALYNKTYEEVVATSGTDNDLYKKSKSTAFAFLYGAQLDKLAKTAGITVERAQEAFDALGKKYCGLTQFRESVISRLSSLKQSKDGGPITYKVPHDYIESLVGFKRYFTLENQVIKTLYDLANSLGGFGFNREIFVQRKKDRLQTLTGATQSAIFAAAFNVQSSIIRAGLNHIIQSTGGEITKELQLRLWNLQPTGINPYMIRIMNVHDELQSVHVIELGDAMRKVIKDFVEEYRSHVPLLAIEWHTNAKYWGDDGEIVKIS